jgi:lysozyme family protein
MTFVLTDDRRKAYLALWETFETVPSKIAESLAVARKLLAHRPIYASIVSLLPIPWYVVGCLHSMECDLDFGCHLANGDPLTARTGHAPIGLPRTGFPPFPFNVAALAALADSGMVTVVDWSIPGILFELEKWNGAGYAMRGINSPYLWASTTVQARGKFVRDGVFDPDYVSGQIGCASLLKSLQVVADIELR